MRNVYTQAHYNLARPACTHHLDLHLVVYEYARMIAPICHMSRRDHMCTQAHMYSRDRSRRT